ncbi:PREDICTED: NAD(P)H-quinone oxidoreductase subunit U, chloroplastic isoform X2 [Ipomoea nil]|uniref:NAD(P)H-quinone oxidoreductase subunit U, chloroplastic isoform X2 n=1 Tax=Ipomoea nil TaxID=35883 RepID=UPI000900D17D|nr:PREDICTED: NAD(P)H-quinone oxidoreductase subunit U, chloroplastic isoform X2 [Ipomoea nil]
MAGTLGNAYLCAQNFLLSPTFKLEVGNGRNTISVPTTNLTYAANYSLYHPRKLVAAVRSSSGDDTAAATTETEETPVGVVSDGPPSLISALNAEKAIRGIAITDVDHYGILGLQRGCPYEQVLVAYNKKVEEAKNEGLEEEDLNNKLQLLQESYRILSTMEERRLYDWSLARSEMGDTYTWPFEVDITQTPKGGTPPPRWCTCRNQRMKDLQDWLGTSYWDG